MAIDFDPTGPGSRMMSRLLVNIWKSPESDPAMTDEEQHKRRVLLERNDRIMRGLPTP